MFTRLLNIGLIDQSDFHQKRETKALNLFALITIIGGLAGTVNIYFLGKAFPSVTLIFQLLASVFIFIINNQRRYQAAAYLFVISMNLTLLFINVLYSTETGNYLYYFPIIFCIALLHNPNKPRTRSLIFFGIILTGFICSRIIKLPLAEYAAYTHVQNSMMFNFNMNLVVILTLTLVYLVIILINKQYRELTDLLNIVQTDQVTIENSLKEKEVLLAEIQHRVKNNLSVIIGLFNLQRESSPNEETKQAMTEAKNRVLSIAMVHERLYKKSNLSHINLRTYISELSKEIVRSHHLHDKISIKEELEELEADITKAVPVGLIVNEVLTNSLKHAFKKMEQKPEIKIMLTYHFGVISVKMSDNGCGFPDNKNLNDKSLGITLIESLASQLDGNIYYKNMDGATVKLTFPV